MQVDWEPGPTEIAPNWAPLLRVPRASVIYSRLVKYRPWCKLTGNLGRLKLLPIGPRAYGAPGLECNLLSACQVHTLVQVDWEPGPTEIVPKWAPILHRPALGVVNICRYVLLATEHKHLGIAVTLLFHIALCRTRTLMVLNPELVTLTIISS